MVPILHWDVLHASLDLILAAQYFKYLTVRVAFGRPFFQGWMALFSEADEKTWKDRYESFQNRGKSKFYRERFCPLLAVLSTSGAYTLLSIVRAFLLRKT